MTDLCSSSCFEHIRHPLILIQHKLPEALDYSYHVLMIIGQSVHYTKKTQKVMLEITGQSVYYTKKTQSFCASPYSPDSIHLQPPEKLQNHLLSPSTCLPWQKPLCRPKDGRRKTSLHTKENKYIRKKFWVIVPARHS